MKFYNTDNTNIPKSGAILVTDYGEVFVAESQDIGKMLDRLLGNRSLWRIERVECEACGESWCEVYKKGGGTTICPNCQEELRIV